ncbi:unnamed protein product (macronuclear) [Paramecium tetraurelia]|uniref:Protein kinase domain-containing protein n=1 Tax=Paramecium tetraurelia TaxID=5888 RepID=A0CFG1_PARTE|nr:uncharacterized protein GSPATT00037967001 [Paramecium tetraurelia]CAK69528.1 unnamed protein product [Paramecium tetraurelia]|eukprot:XP_001436925.1 hypothetical protein (macronuclear) [Paramecium tetraurelia strain d4-2]
MQIQKRKQNTFINHNSTYDFGWLLNFTDAFSKHELQQSNMKQLPKAFVQNDFLLQSEIYIYNLEQEQFVLQKLELYPNMIISDNLFLILSTCTIQKTKIEYREFNAQGLKLCNQLGQTYLFFITLKDLTNWTKYAKKFCKLSNFLQKYTIKERTNVPNVFACVKNKNNSVYTVNIFRLQDFDKNPSLYEQLMNEVNILMSLKHPCLLKYCSLYEDQQHLYILYEYWVGDPLYKLLEQGLVLNSTQISNIVYQLIKFVKFLHKQNLYHAQITPQNIILLRNASLDQLQIVLINFAYREEIGVVQLIKKLPKQWIPPEMQLCNVQYPQKIDQFQIGCTLFYLCVYKPVIKGSCQSFSKSIENIDISFLRLRQEQALSEKSILSLSQIDLLQYLIQPDPIKRKDLQELSNHHWFVNEKAKFKQIGKQKLLPSLRTILEIREQSSMEVKLTRPTQRLSIASIESDDDEDINLQDLNCSENNHLTDIISILNSQNLSVHKC